MKLSRRNRNDEDKMQRDTKPWNINTISGYEASLLHNKLTVAPGNYDYPCVVRKTYGRDRLAT